ncbi:MAG: hypothetical protein IJC48_08675 [Clostridia bacterium]|nr:hypothetical protein [Clostridia bacterium]
MTYALLLWPHSNQRYEEAAVKPAIAELELLLAAAGVSAKCEYAVIAGAGAVIFQSDELNERQLSVISNHSLLFWFGILSPDQSFKPLFASPDAYLGADLPYIQKYKGKTNERFTQQLINLALYSTKFSDTDEKLTLLDPMCGRGTTLFQAVNREWNACGMDADKKDVHECAAFFEKYLKFHKFKHKRTQTSKTIQNQPPVMVQKFVYGGDKGDQHYLMVGSGDCMHAANVYGKNQFHIIACDLPYGVQHAPNGKGGEKSFEDMLRKCLPVWKEALKKGGAIAVSYNTHTLKTDRVRSLMEEAGLQVMAGGAYDCLSHWVEQAVMRDAAVCIKK